MSASAPSARTGPTLITEKTLSRPRAPCGHASVIRIAPHRAAWCTILDVVAKLDRARLQALVEPHWRRLYNFVFRLTLDRERAERYLADIFSIAVAKADQAPAEAADAEVWLLGIANQVLEERLPRQPEVNFDILDE